MESEKLFECSECWAWRLNLQCIWSFFFFLICQLRKSRSRVKLTNFSHKVNFNENNCLSCILALMLSLMIAVSWFSICFLFAATPFLPFSPTGLRFHPWSGCLIVSSTILSFKCQIFRVGMNRISPLDHMQPKEFYKVGGSHRHRYCTPKQQQIFVLVLCLDARSLRLRWRIVYWGSTDSVNNPVWWKMKIVVTGSFITTQVCSMSFVRVKFSCSGQEQTVWKAVSDPLVDQGISLLPYTSNKVQCCSPIS